MRESEGLSELAHYPIAIGFSGTGRRGVCVVMVNHPLPVLDNLDRRVICDFIMLHPFRPVRVL